jgi:hypothetical protein
LKTIIAGSRGVTNYQFVKAFLDSTELKITEVVSGGARGADKLGEQWAAENGVPLKIFPAQWSIYGKGAGYIRNREMAQYADALIAFWDGKSKGTANMINEAKKQGLTVLEVHYVGV